MKKISIQQAMFAMGVAAIGSLSFAMTFPENVFKAILFVGIAIVSVLTVEFILLIHTLKNR